MRMKRRIAEEPSRTDSGPSNLGKRPINAIDAKPPRAAKRLKPSEPNPQELGLPVLIGGSIHAPAVPSISPKSPKVTGLPEHVIPRETHPRDLNAVKPSRSIPENTDTVQPLSSPIIVKCSWPNNEKDEVEPEMNKACEGAFGAPQFLFSFPTCFREGQPMSNSIFLPSEGENRHWPFFRDSKEGPPKQVDRRTLCITVLASEGRTFEKCEDASDLCECLLHAMLGWLVAYSKGYLHRHISIGTLLKLLKPYASTEFSAVKSLESLPSPQNSTLPPALSDLAEKLDEALKPYEVTGEKPCKAILTDGDLAAYIPTYFDSVHDPGPLSGTTEFMSTRLLDGLREEQDILQCPVDDLWSFFWTALWAVLFNSRDQGKSKAEKLWRDDIRGHYANRDKVANRIRDDLIADKEDHSIMFKKMRPLLRDWHRCLAKITSSWIHDESQNGSSPAALLILSHKYAYEAVLDFVSVLTQSGLVSNNSK